MIKEYLSRDSVNIQTHKNAVEKTSTMKDAFSNQAFNIEDNIGDRQRIQNKLMKNTVVFGHDKNNYLTRKHSRTDSQALAMQSQESKLAAESVKQKLQSHNFKFGSYKPEYSLSSNPADKQLLTQEAVAQALKLNQDSKVKKRMYSTQSSWTTKKKFNGNISQHTKSRSNFESPGNSFSRDMSMDKKVNENKSFVRDVDMNDLKKSSIKFGDGTFGDLNGAFGQKPNLFWNVNRGTFSKTLDRKRYNNSPMHKRPHMLQASIKLGEHQKSQIINTSASEQYKSNQVPKDVREKDQEVHNFMKGKHVHLGSNNDQGNSEAKSRYPLHSKAVIDQFNGEIPMNSNFKKSIYLSGSPNREKQFDSRLSLYGENIPEKDASANILNEKNKQLKRELLAHAFNLGYGKNTHVRGPGADVIQHMRQHSVPVTECKSLKQKNEKQNFTYHKDISVGQNNGQNSFNYELHNSRYAKGLSQNTKLPMDYWKTNFTFNQVAKQTETGSLSNSTGDYTGTHKSSIGSTRSGFSDFKGFSKANESSLLQKNKVNSTKTNFTVGYSKNEFDTSYKNQYLWKVPKVDI